MQSRAIEVVTADGFRLGGRQFEPDEPARATVLVHGATAVKSSFYRAFAEYLADAGLRVVTYDYRGVGLSRPPSLRGFEATIADWAKLDAAAMHDYVARLQTPLVIVGHSFGGQLIGLVDEAHRADAAVLVGAQLGYFGHWPLRSRLRLAFIWRVLVPSLSAMFGYLPGQAGLGNDLPRGVAEQWARWCRHPGYLMGEYPDAAARFAAFERPVLAYSFTDDAFAPPAAVAHLHRHLASADLEHHRVDPARLGLDEIGHFGYFRSSARRLWDETIESIDAMLDAGPSGHVTRRDDGLMHEIMADLRYPASA